MPSHSNLLKSSRKVYEESLIYLKVPNPEQDALRAKLEGSFYEFVKWAWSAIEAIPFIDGWHIKAVCDHLELAYTCEIKHLIINVPPGTMKSTILSMFNAWCWANEPWLKFLCVSGTKRLAIKDSDRCRRIIDSLQYQKLWGDKVKLRHNSKSKQIYENTAHGHRLAYSMRASVRGEGGNFVIVDDGNSDQDYYSSTMREATNEYLDSNLYLRLRGSTRVCLINIQQRIHQFDLSGHILSKGVPVVHLRLPMEFEADNPCSTVPLKTGQQSWIDPRKTEGELLWPNGLTADVVDKIKRNLRTEYNIAGQLQQRPSPKTGGLIKVEWFKRYERVSLPKLIYVLQSWDTAITVNKASCYSAFTTWGVFQDDQGYNNLILLNCWRGKLEYPDLKEMIKRCSEDYMCQSLHGPLKATRRPDMILMEKAANGSSLMQDLFRSGLRITPFDPKNHGFKSGTSVSNSSKIGRAKIASSFIEQGFVWVPMIPPDFRITYKYVEMFLEATKLFPMGDGADIIDSMSQALIKLSQNLDINYRGQKPDETRIDWRAKGYEMSAMLERQSNNYGRV